MIPRFLAAAPIALALPLHGCAIDGGQIDTLPQTSSPSQAGTLVIRRDGSLVGLFATMLVSLDKRPLYRLGRNERYSLTLDPGEYNLEYRIGLNECGGGIRIEPHRTLRLKLVPNCTILVE